MDPATLQAYDTHAAEFADRYASTNLSPLHRLLLAIEYHRTPRQDNPIVSAADFTNGSLTGEYAAKRLRMHPAIGSSPPKTRGTAISVSRVTDGLGTPSVEVSGRTSNSRRRETISATPTACS